MRLNAAYTFQAAELVGIPHQAAGFEALARNLIAITRAEPTTADPDREIVDGCHFFRHHPGPECIPLLACHLHQALIAHGEHLTHRCSGWSEDLHRQRGWAPEVA